MVGGWFVSFNALTTSNVISEFALSEEKSHDITMSGIAYLNLSLIWYSLLGTDSFVSCGMLLYASLNIWNIGGVRMVSF